MISDARLFCSAPGTIAGLLTILSSVVVEAILSWMLSPLAYCCLMNLFFPPIIVDRGIYIVEFGGYYFIVILDFSLCCRFRSSRPGFSLSVPSLLGGSTVEFQWFSSTNHAAQCQVGPCALSPCHLIIQTFLPSLRLVCEFPIPACIYSRVNK